MELFRPALSFLAEICRGHGGTVDSTAGDSIFVIFGVPKAMENSARAAINAAIEMHNRIGPWSREQRIDPPLEIHTGINGGQVASGHFVTGEAIMGDPVNVASQIKDKSPKGQIWVGPETWRAARRDFEFRDLGPIEFKNHADVRVHEVVSRALRLHRPAA